MQGLYRPLSLMAALTLAGCATSSSHPSISAAWRPASGEKTYQLPTRTELAASSSPVASFHRIRDESQSTSQSTENSDSSKTASEVVEQSEEPKSEILQTSSELPPSPADEEIARIDAAGPRSMAKAILPIDLITVMRLVNSNSPTIAVSQAKVREAYARAEAADFLWLPNITVGSVYNRFDGQTQNQRGEVFSKSRANLFGNGGLALTLDTSDAYYRPLIEWRMASAAQRQYSATLVTSELEAILAYLDLLQVQELLNLNRDTLEKGESLLEAARNAQQAKLDRSPGDVNRVRTEVLLRRQERADLSGRAAAASARLARLLLLDPGVQLTPQFVETIPITLIDSELPLEDLLVIASYNRQELAAIQDQLAAAFERLRKAEQGPWMPKLQVADQVGSFGGGINGDLQDFQGRNALTAMVYWELRNFGYGNMAETRERQAGMDQTAFQQAELQARVAAEVVEAAEVARAKSESITLAREAVEEAAELYRISHEGTFNVLDAKNLFDALRPLQALQFLNQARQNFIAAVMDYNRAQYRLNAALGCPGDVPLAANKIE